MYWTPNIPGKCPLRDITRAYLYEFFFSSLLLPIAYFQCEPAVASGPFSVTLCVCVCFFFLMFVLLSVGPIIIKGVWKWCLSTLIVLCLISCL